MSDFNLEEPTPNLLSDLKQSEEDEKAGKVVYFNTGEGVLRYLDDEIKNEKMRQLGESTA